MRKNLICGIVAGGLCVVTAAYLQGCGDSGLEDAAGLSKTGLSVRAHCGTGAGAASGNGVSPTFEDGNPTCSDLLGSSDFETEFKTNTPSDGTFAISADCDVTIDVRNTNCGQVFDFDVSGPCVINAIFVKGGPNGNLFDYNPDGETMDTGLHSPVNPNNNRFYGLSHISFCLSDVPVPVCVASFVDDTACGGPEAMFCAQADAGSFCDPSCTVTITDPDGNDQSAPRANEVDFCISATEAGCYTAVITDARGTPSENDCKACAIIDVGNAGDCP